MILGLCTISRRADPLAEVCAEAAAVGVEAIELWGQPPHLPELSEAAGAAAGEVVRAAGQRPLVLGSYLRLGTPSFAAQVDGVVAAARGYGAELIRVWAGAVSDAEADEAAWNRCAEDTMTLLERCGDLRITVERHGKTLTESLAGAERFLAISDDPRLGLNFQHRAGADTATTIAEIDACWPRINNVHAQNAGPHGPSTPAAGTLDYRAIIGRLKTLGYTGAVEIEFVRRAGGEPPAGADEHRALLRADVELLRVAMG